MTISYYVVVFKYMMIQYRSNIEYSISVPLKQGLFILFILETQMECLYRTSFCSSFTCHTIQSRDITPGLGHWSFTNTKSVDNFLLRISIKKLVTMLWKIDSKCLPIIQRIIFIAIMNNIKFQYHLFTINFVLNRNFNFTQ